MKALKIVVLGFVTLAVLASGCGRGSKPSNSGGGGNFNGGGASGPLTAAEIAGTHVGPCLVVTDNSYGSNINGYSFYRTLTLNNDSTYDLSVLLFEGATCVGGTQIFAYDQAGTYALGSLMTSPSDATEILYTSNSSQLAVYGGSTGGGAVSFGDSWVSIFNNDCFGITAFTSGIISIRSVAGLTCGMGGLSLPEFPADGSVFYDAIALDSRSAPTTVSVFMSDSIFHTGQLSSYPTTATYDYTF